MKNSLFEMSQPRLHKTWNLISSPAPQKQRFILNRPGLVVCKANLNVQKLKWIWSLETGFYGRVFAEPGTHISLKNISHLSCFPQWNFHSCSWDCPLPLLLFELIEMSATGRQVKDAHDTRVLRKWRVKPGQFRLSYLWATGLESLSHPWGAKASKLNHIEQARLGGAHLQSSI